MAQVRPLEEQQHLANGLQLDQHDPEGDDPQPDPTVKGPAAVRSAGTAGPGHGADVGVQLAWVETGDRPQVPPAGPVGLAAMPSGLVETVAYKESPTYSVTEHKEFIELAQRLLEATKANRITWEQDYKRPDRFKYDGASGRVILQTPDEKYSPPIEYQVYKLISTTRGGDVHTTEKLLLNWVTSGPDDDVLEGDYKRVLHPLYDEALR